MIDIRILLVTAHGGNPGYVYSQVLAANSGVAGTLTERHGPKERKLNASHSYTRIKRKGQSKSILRPASAGVGFAPTPKESRDGAK